MTPDTDLTRRFALAAHELRQHMRIITEHRHNSLRADFGGIHINPTLDE